ncbi:hypothetical protein [Pseudomonas tremae]|uniref:hypothetical protein n=1 Tax=Pseudomonas tremae TaxID=200454 RepID=UPI000301E3B1|nr:hypothetical protein [Pseudomonas tremae]
MTPCTLFYVLPIIDFNQRLAISPDLTVDAIVSRAIKENPYAGGQPAGNCVGRWRCGLNIPFMVHNFSVRRGSPSKRLHLNQL